uniref:Band 4.1 domain-containing protein n=1 Tax=Trichobilharzia regenti TaxID=157069 RepID=A0AA85IVG0_TRIRE|nr:unnamed protein product [Trichobilharzia regenti]
MLADGEYVDGSWLLSVHIDDLNIDRQIRVHGEWSIGELLVQLTEGLTCPLPKPLGPNEISLRSSSVRIGWGDYGLWWPARSKWLLRSQSSLNQYGLQADAKLRFLSIYGSLHVQLPDLQIREFVDVNYAEPVFRVTLSLCRYLNIRHPEELSLAHPIQQNDLKHSRFAPGFIDRRYHTISSIGRHATFQRSATINTTHSQYKTLCRESLFQMNGVNNTNEADRQDRANSEGASRKSSSSSRQSAHLFGPPRIRDKRTHFYPNYHRYSRPDSGNFSKITYSPIAFDLRILDDSSLAFSPTMSVEDAIQKGLIVRPSNYTQRVRLNAAWLDSSKSLLEQGIDARGYLSKLDNLNSPPISRPASPTHLQNGDHQNKPTKEAKKPPTLLLRYKYGTFYDLNIKYDAIRINQLYEQAKWSIISEILEVTDEEACLFAALQAQAELATEQEALLNDENLSHSQEMNGNTTAIANTTANGTNQLLDNLLEKSIAENCKTNMKKITSTMVIHNRDISPLGRYLHTGRHIKTLSRPMSAVELDSEIDAMLEELSMNCLENTDGCLPSDGIKTQHRSRPRQRSPRPLSLLDNMDGGSDLLQDTNDSDPGLPELNTYVKICKPRKFGLKVYRRYFMAVKRTELFVYKNKDDYKSESDAAEVIYLPGCEIQPDLCVSSEKFIIRLYVPVSRTNLPLSTAFATNSHLDDLQTDDEDPTVGTKLKRRASLLSLTSLSHLSNVLGISSNGSHNGPIGVSGIGALSGSSAAMTGLVNELWLRFPSLNDYMDWLAVFRITTAVHSTVVPSLCTDMPDAATGTRSTSPAKRQRNIASYLLNRATFDAERKAISNLMHLISPSSFKADQTDNIVNVTKLHNYLEKRLIDMLPLRLGYLKGSQRTWDYRRDPGDTLSRRSATILSQDKPPIHPSTNQFMQTRNSLIQRVSATYTQIYNLTSLQAKLKYINAWEQLRQHGIVFFPARIEVTVPLNSILGSDACSRSEYGGTSGWIPGINRPSSSGNVTVSMSRKAEAVGIGATRIYRCDLSNGEILASWRMSTVQGWHINWELSEVVLMLASQLHHQQQQHQQQHQSTSQQHQQVQSKTDHYTTKSSECSGRVIIRPIDVSVRTVAEFLGGYTFLNLRAPEKNQCLAEDTFYKLTTGMPLPPI